MTTYVNASCQCELNAFRVAFDTASLPISNEICHCSTCRHSSGQMALAHVTIKGVPLVRANGLSVHSSRSPNTTTYKTSPDATRYFCTSCSAQLFWVHHVNGGDIWNVAVGVLERTEGVVRRTHHIWVGDTLDGGAADHLQVVAGLRLPRYKEGEGSEVLPVGWRADRLACAAENPTTKEQLKAFCHCGNVSFIITRPSEASFAPSAAYPDLLFPYNVSHMSKIINANDEKWWLRPKSSPHPTKYLAGHWHCVCSRCRLGGGFEIQSWTYVSRANVIEVGSEEPIELVHEADRPKGLRQYSSSPGKYREFCSTCGATAFWWHANRPDLIAVAIGLLDQGKDGVRAEEWLKWHKERLSFIENAKMSSGAVQGLKEGMASESDLELEVASGVISQN
ncbi:hypothetical protein BDN70DRAFT_832540 [Pholiota conissans]|uniref:CENP-V/GFA domain-containing protein n=1 Tax=Pholiota conissans TaxID=109636 RepID=A0A9P6CVC6_9AGAR|nr:hypothetical protein BDN70DRAFT_832540 [Pholiota conissans]